MNPTLTFMRLFFMALSILFMTTFMVAGTQRGGTFPALPALKGALIGAIFGLFLIFCDRVLRRFNLRALNILILGLFIGYLLGEALILILNGVLTIGTHSIELRQETLELLKTAFYLFGVYLGCILTMRASDEFYVSIPFVKFAQVATKKRDIIIDGSALADTRTLLMARTGLFNDQLIVPSFVLKDFYTQLDGGDEAAKKAARAALDNLKTLQEMRSLGVRINETDFPEVQDPKNTLLPKLTRLARLLSANLLTAQPLQVDVQKSEDLIIISLEDLSQVFKAALNTGSIFEIKIQHAGKGDGQGVGYLEDKTMVVVNGGKEKVGSTVKAIVISERSTVTGRIIFCNLYEEKKSE